MSIDGSFSCDASLRRILARCPSLRCNPQLLALERKGGELTADELVAAMAEPFLHPSYTIPIMGCFRPLCQRIVDRAVAKVRDAPSLESDLDEARGDEIGEENLRVVDFYVGRKRGLRLHELTSLALCRALDLAPFLLRCVLNYFKSSLPPFARLISLRLASPITAKDASLLLDATRVPYRFLTMEPKVFSELWDWSCFNDLVEQLIGDLGFFDKTTSLDDALDIRWCTVQILSIVFKISDKVTESFGIGAEEAFICLRRWEEFCMDTSLEKAGWYLQASEAEHDGSCPAVSPTVSPKLESLESISIVDSFSTLHVKEVIQKHCRSDFRHPFVLTSTLRKSFEVALMAVSQKWPVLLHGPVGAGKTALINKLAEISGSRVLFIHLDEQMDSKTLLGSYICTEQPGEFKWHPGSLTQAVVNGFWIVFENIDKAPSDIQSTLLPLLEGSSLFMTGHGEAVEVAESFRLFATITTLKHEVSNSLEGRLSFSVLWRKLMVGNPSREDMLDIVNTCYPRLQCISSRLIKTFERVNSLIYNQLGGMSVAGTLSSGGSSRFSLRDLLKWCKRIASLGIKFSDSQLSAADWHNIFQEAVDIFAASSSSLDKRSMLMREIARVFGVHLSEGETSKPIIETRQSELQVGRVTLESSQSEIFKHKRPFVCTWNAMHTLERVACSVKYNEPVLLVGETGTGKTTLIQDLAMRLGRPLTVMNLSQQSDVTDILGGFKPVDARSICIPLYHEFKDLFCGTFSGKDNVRLLRYCEEIAMKKEWKKLLGAIQKCAVKAQELINKEVKSRCGSKRKRPFPDWHSFSLRLNAACSQIGAACGMSFKFVEGAFITALRTGQWVLLDEVNLAPPDTLQRISAVLDGEDGTLCLAERGDVDYLKRHRDFRIFACMNPATDAGKRELPYFFRSRFTEYFVDDILDDKDLELFVNQYMNDFHSTGETTKNIVRFYKAAKLKSEESLQDGAHQKPQFSLRSLARALEYTKKAAKKFDFRKALYDGFCMFFLTLLDGPSANIMNNILISVLLDGNLPPRLPFDVYFSEIREDQSRNYVLTPSVKEHLNNLARAVYIKRYPVLLQGPTSSGKTSLVHYLASVTGHEFVRINNHEHTDLQEYFGSYITDSHGKLKFQEGALVKAVREGHWIVLDELNLAPSDVLEALNRLLDDNRELFVPELQEKLSAHPDFMLFATQNPPVLYGGRKMLSRAFRNRFVEIHFHEIPEDELATILEKRCQMPLTYGLKMVEVMKDLQLHRQNSRVFAGKHGFITPRDLFRWANRYKIFGRSYEDLAKDGYLLLAERLRDEDEKRVVWETLKRRLPVELNLDVKLNDDFYRWERDQSDTFCKLTEDPRVRETFGSITWTRSMSRLFLLVERCYKMREPVLLVGETGGGKTTVCQVLSVVLGATLHTLNCHQYTETTDFIGGFCPVRDRSRLAVEFKDHVTKANASKIFLHIAGDAALSSDISNASCTIDQINGILSTCKKGITFYSDITQRDVDELEEVKLDLMQLQEKYETIFTWQDGPLVHAMKYGDLLLVDEISLADDSVLERLNSVLEPERKLTLSEKGGEDLEKITAHPNFFILATMNPGGDYGKKELSPALRNRFTEIWVPTVVEIDELKAIAIERFAKPELSCYADCIVNFWQWFRQLQTSRTLTVRDLQSWISFVNVTEGSLGVNYALVHGLFLVLLDGLSLGTGISRGDADKLRESCLSFLLQEIQKVGGRLFDSGLARMENYGWAGKAQHTDIILCKDAHPADYFGISPFYIRKGYRDCKQEGYEFFAPTTRRNLMRILRAMQVKDNKPVLLEGSPGVGKTSLIVALAAFSGHSVVRINLSEQTDMMDLFGSDLPVQGENGMEFSWSDGILLQALKSGSWVLLDELNLAPQSVLEGLNAILDHRAEVYIPELGVTFKCPNAFRVFACQNPSSQGGGRKGLPKSFLNRFTKVYVDELSPDDFFFICKSRFQSVKSDLLSDLIKFNNKLYEDTMIHGKYGKEGSPWEFNLRDVFRSCEIIEGSPENSKKYCFLNTVYLQRMRTVADRLEVIKLYESIFDGVKPVLNQHSKLYINPEYLIVGSVTVKRNHLQPARVWNTQLNILPGFSDSLEAAMHCLQQQWLCILVGPYSSGKTSLIRLLAQLTGNACRELNLSSGTDVSELLGCFEQYNFIRHYKAVVSQVECYVDEYFGLRLEEKWKNLIAGRKSLFAKWFEFLAAKNHNYSTSALANTESWKCETFSSLTLLIEIIEQLKHDLELFQLPVSWSQDILVRSLKTVLDLQRNKSMQQPVNFEWVAGDLIKAIEYGEWVVLDNANLCNPTVLDRINSLVEPDGSITINECGLVDGNPMILHAHPNFRMFLTVDPKLGEVSRAMRNRGVEIFLMEQNWQVDGRSEVCVESEINDVKRLLILSGIPGNNLVSSMAEAHMYAKVAGLHLGIRITLLEVARWVQLFQQLLIKGNQPKWSLQLSWEHTYLPSLGECDGIRTIMEGKCRFLNDECFTSDMLSGCSLSLPGGWPMPHKLRNFVQYSKEACVKRNLLYLESLGSKFTSCELMKISRGTSSSKSKKIHPLVMPIPMIRQLLFPDLSGQQAIKYDNEHLELVLTNRKFFIAANWAIEQATESDIGLYDIWFKWYGLLVQPYCQFFSSFSKLLVEERGHPIWGCIFECRRKLISHYKIDVNLHPVPLLSLELVDLIGSDNAMEPYLKRLSNAIPSVGLLRSSYQQWDAENNYFNRGNLQEVRSVFELLRNLERKVLEGIVESHELLKEYPKLLAYHRMFWNNITSLDFEGAAVSWNFMKKKIVMLQPRFREASLLLEGIKASNFLTLSLHYGEPALWIYGGHPVLPSSAAAFYKVRQLLTFINIVWSKTKFLKQNIGDDQCLVDAVRSTNTEIRRLAMEALGLCMSGCIATKSGADDSNIVSELKQLHQNLLRKVEAEEMNIKLLFRSATERHSLISGITTCCSYSPEILCSRSGFNSWLANLPLLDLKSFNLDIMLLNELANCTLVDTSDGNQVVPNISNLLQYALDFSLNSSSRSPVEFTPHQMILRILDARSSDSVNTGKHSVNTVHKKIANCVLEMWYNYHSSLWTHCSGGLKSLFKISYDESCHLVYPTKTPVIGNILQDCFCIKDFDVNRLKLRVASKNLWEDARLQGNLIRCLHSAAGSLFRQILSAHKKYFQGDFFREMQSVLFRLSANGLTNEDSQILKSLVTSTSHHMLRSELDPLIEAFLKELYFKFPSDESQYNLGCAWLHIGVLRFLLLFDSYSPDPAAKYSLKHSLIVDRLSSLELKIKVCRDCEQLAGSSSGSYNDNTKLLKLEEKERKSRTKVVFRPQPSKCNGLRSVCADFRARELVSVLSMLDMDLTCNENLPLFVDRACSWQVSSANFIRRLSEEYSEYIDLIQPIQVAVYEMKFGLSIAVSNAIEREYLNKVAEENIGRILDAIYSLMQFPVVSIDLSDIDSTYLESVRKGFESKQVDQINLLKKLIRISNGTCSGDTRGPSQLITSIYHIVLMNITYRICSSLLMDKDSFLCLHNIFDHFTSLWVDMKSEQKVKESNEAQYYKFRLRSIEMEDILEGDISALLVLDTDGNMTSETKDELGQEFMKKMNTATNEYKHVDKDWDFIPESILRSVVLIHNQLFGSSDLFEKSSICHLADEHRLQSFMESYELGTTLIKDLQSYTSSVLDDHLMPEHLLRLCLNYEQTSGISCKPTNAYNIYKEPNSSVMFKMVKPLTVLRDRVKSFLDEWPEHPILQNILEITESLLAFPLNSPLSKALLGLQLLIGRAQSLQENDSRYSFTDELQPIYMLVSSWQKLELDCWPSLLDGVQEKCDMNARKLWFPLRALIHRTCSGDPREENISTIQSIDDFIQTSSIGEFKRRLQLVLALHGELSYGTRFSAYSSSSMRENLNILYNVFGYYIQFLPLVLKHIKDGRSLIDKDLRQHLRLFSWEQLPHSCTSIEKFRRARQKMLKLVKKFNDVLQENVMGLVNQEVALTGSKVLAWLDRKVSDEMRAEELQFSVALVDFRYDGRFLWYEEWRSKADSTLRSMSYRDLSVAGPFKVQGFSDVIRQSPYPESAQTNFHAEWEEYWTSLEKVGRNTAELAHIWKNGTKNPKRRALANLFKTLEGCGLSKHRSLNNMLEDSGKSSLLRSSYNVLHLLLQPCCEKSSQDTEIILPVQSNEPEDKEWLSANWYYFKSLAMMQQLQDLKFHKDLDLEQVNRALSFVDHLISILYQQREVAYSLSEHLKNLRKQYHLIYFAGRGNNSSLSPNQNALLRCMWQQKKVFDDLLIMSRDTSLLLGTVKNTHLSTCQVVKTKAADISALVDKFIPRFMKSKDSLDMYLIGHDRPLAVSPEHLPLVVTTEMQQLVDENWKTLSYFGDDIERLGFHDASMRSVVQVLLTRFEVLINKGKMVMEDFHAEVMENNQYQQDSAPVEKLEALYSETFERTKKLIVGLFTKLGVLYKGDKHAQELTSGNIPLWNDLVRSYVENLQIDNICTNIHRTAVMARQLVDCTNRKIDVCSLIETQLENLHALSTLLFTYAEHVLSEYLHAHRTTAEMTHALMQVFALLLSEGFGSADEPPETNSSDQTQNASGTGMGQGEGINDVSDQIDDESQLIGGPEKQDGLDKSDQFPNGKDKGIEMDEDFSGDMFSVSEDSGDEDSGDENDIKLESQMGESGVGDQVVGEKAWDKDEDGNTQNSDEKYESGPSIKETDPRSRELRAKDDDALIGEETGEMATDENDESTEVDNETTNADDDKVADDVGLDKSNAFEDPTGVKLEEKDCEDINMDETEDFDTMDEVDPGTTGSDEEMLDEYEDSNPPNHTDEENAMQVDEDNDMTNPGEGIEDTNMESSKEKHESANIESFEHPTKSMPTSDHNGHNGMDSNMVPEANWANSSDISSAAAPSINFSNEVPKLEISLPASNGSRVSSNFSESQALQSDNSSLQIKQTNPLRSIGDAVEEWKESAKVSLDPQDLQAEALDGIDDKNVDEFMYVSEAEKGTSQAFGAATSDQIRNNIESDRTAIEDGRANRREEDKVDMTENTEGSLHKSVQHLNPRAELDAESPEKMPDSGSLIEELQQNDFNNRSGDIVSFTTSFMDDERLPCNNLTNDKELSCTLRVEVSHEEKQQAVLDWKTHERVTTRLSHELAEQLRLVMEPTLANKLEGDYRTGKRINMKKVIPYIASHFRKDKIWLRRTKPNKRDYQVVVAVDDSRSMSESHCGKIAAEALVTVCRAMSQLEVGQFAVASFGQKGKIKLLHDFDEPFTGEAAAKMISSLSFKQDNTIADDPMVDLLKYLNNLLDTAVAKSRTPSGQNPLHQLVLIIADGRLYEKENLRRYVRDLLSRKRMIAFILLDSPRESIMDLTEASYEGDKLSFKKYMNSFPFPYYIVLENIEALPRTLAGLLRQWFELMQSLID